MKAFVCAVALLLAFQLGSRSEIVIYKGPVQSKYNVRARDGGSVPPPLVRAYLLIDFTAQKLTHIYFYDEGSQKTYLPQSFPESVHTSVTVLPSGKSVTIVATGTGNSDPEYHFYAIVWVRGTNGSLTVKTQPVPVLTTRPPVINYERRLIHHNSDPGTLYFESDCVGRFDRKATQEANNAGRTLVQARDALIKELEAKGYVKKQ